MAGSRGVNGSRQQVVGSRDGRGSGYSRSGRGRRDSRGMADGVDCGHQAAVDMGVSRGCVLVFMWVKGSEQQAVGSKRSSGTVHCETFGG